MQVITDYKNIPNSAKNSVIAIGNFDGIHKGHLEVINHGKAIAKQNNYDFSILTFSPHPLLVLNHDIKPFFITSDIQKQRMLRKLGVNNLFCIDFNKEFSKISAEAFISEILLNKLTAKHIITGENFIFGHNRSGNTNLLHKFSQSLGFGYTAIKPFMANGEICSSSLIRQKIKDGNIKSVKSLLGRNFSIIGQVQEGMKKGNTIGFPTANIKLGNYIRPAFGVYACKIHVENSGISFGAANIGIKPSFSAQQEGLEVHIFNFSSNIYNKEIEVELIDYIRPEKKFTDINMLKQQITEDCTKIKTILEQI